ncbi:SelT/SelW/SelH family protein [Haloarcula sp. JP-L23]|uniref:SelT/SelW/SelH family protein n=1 Tax=Haloarcula sp. JP-L23 TaxID=2716717 RepID=UPI00140F4457|nr:SelT/SelW/SelH family protein [Haloarcula sp. JP-L23]
MTSVEIEYCVPCGLLEPAVEAQTRLLNEFGQELDGVTLTPGHGGVFIVRADGETVWDKGVHGADLDLELLVEAVGDRLPAEV